MPYRLLVTELKDVPAEEAFLNPRELKAAEEFRLDKRRKEWVAGRYALKKLATSFFTFEMKKMEVRNHPSGKPMLLVPGGTHLPVSITHSGDYAAAVIALTGENVGIDLEIIEKRGVSWAEQSFNKEEISSNAAFFLTELWAKKEAVLKFLGVGLSIDMTDIRFINGRQQLYGKALDIWAGMGSPKIKVDVKDLDGGYKLAVASEAPNI
jgi:4'-phosphopantetheinyl transferase